MDEIVDAFSARLVAKRRPSFKSFMVVLPYIRGDLPYNEDGPVAPITYLLSKLSLNGSVQRTCEEDETMTPPESETHPAAEAINEKPNTFPQMREPVVQKHNPVTPPVVVYSSPISRSSPLTPSSPHAPSEQPFISSSVPCHIEVDCISSIVHAGPSSVVDIGHSSPAISTTPHTPTTPSPSLGESSLSTSSCDTYPISDPAGGTQEVDCPVETQFYPSIAPPSDEDMDSQFMGNGPTFPVKFFPQPESNVGSQMEVCANETQPIFHPWEQQQAEAPNESATQQSGYQHHTVEEMNGQGVFPNGHWQPATGTADFITHPDVSTMLWITTPSTVEQPGAPSGDPYPPQYGFPSPPYFTSENVSKQVPVPGLNEAVDVSTGLSPYPNGGLAPPITTHSGMFSLSAIDPQLSGISGPDPMPQESMPLTCDIPQPGVTYSATHPDVSSTLWITAPSMAQQPGVPSGDPYPPQYGFPFTSENVPQQAPVPGLNEVVDVSTGLSPYPNGGLAPPITSHSGTFPLSVIDPQLLAISGLNPMPQESMPEDPPDSHDRPMRPLPRRGVPQSQAGPPTSVCDLLALNNIGTREFCLALKKYQETTDNKYSATSCNTLLQMFQQYSLLNSAPFVFAAWTCETQPLGDDPTRVEFTLRDLESPQDDPVRLTFQQILLVIKFICGTLPLYQINVTSLDTP
ncbi:hypothetical protein BU17DRAFT_103793 [Hysterangium stoloniferum]|nr:hypothetical protein BU17DRAFT_103793 [Hysterangium stoloniferum]